MAALGASGGGGIMAFLHMIQRLKLIQRTGWLDHGVRPAESIADHMHRMAVMAMLVDDPTLDKNRCAAVLHARRARSRTAMPHRCVKMAVVHVRFGLITLHL